MESKYVIYGATPEQMKAVYDEYESVFGERPPEPADGDDYFLACSNLEVVMAFRAIGREVPEGPWAHPVKEWPSQRKEKRRTGEAAP